MLLEFGLRNFFSFKEGVEISFKLDSRCPESISLGRNFATVVGIKGANGSGKTHILRGLSFLARFCTDSFDSKPDSLLAFEPFVFNREPSEFYVEFESNKILYRYELLTTDSEIHRETIYRTRAKQTKIIERIGNQIVDCTKEFSELESMKLRKNASLISTAHQYELASLSGIYTFFNNVTSNVGYNGPREQPRNIGMVSSLLKSSEDWFDFTTAFIKKCDVGISSISIHDNGLADDKIEYYPIFHHPIGDEVLKIRDFHESSGTKTLYRELLYFKWMLDVGGVLVVDEFGANLHPHILPLLLNLFLDPEINHHNAQLLLSTHDEKIIDILGRYRTYLVNKEKNESFAYRLDEIPGDILRNDRPISPIYNDGKIGGVPRL